MNRKALVSAEQSIAHLDANRWQAANRRLAIKMIAEFSHERLFEPMAEEETEGATHWARYTLSAGQGGDRGGPDVVYRFEARVLALEHWHIQPDSLVKQVDGEAHPVDAVALAIEFQHVLGIEAESLPVYLEELTATLYAMAYKFAAGELTADQFVAADFQDIEAAMTEGHPAFVANSGRIGFDADDYRAYTPEAAAPIRLLWLAVHRSRAQFSCSTDRTEAQHMESELDAATREGFAESLANRSLDTGDYHYMPVHPWQWHNKLIYLFASEIASQHLVYLGFGPDVYQAQQSIRTLFNRDTSQRCYVKTALSILNMGFIRGLSPYYMSGTPEINDWIDRMVRQDTYLRLKGFSILREVASIGYRHPHFESAIPKTDTYNKMLAALWRESPQTQLEHGQQLMTMAALLHRDNAGRPVLGALIEASGLAIEKWISRYLDVYMSPILHCFYAHDLVFMPHGENIILVMEEQVPVRVIMKDIAEEVGIFNTDIELPGEVARLIIDVPEHLKVLSLFTDLFDLFFRYIAEILDLDLGYAEAHFWRRVADCVQAYLDDHPEYAKKFATYDLFAPEFARSCVNRLQLRNHKQMIDLDDPVGNLQLVGTLANPIADL